MSITVTCEREDNGSALGNWPTDRDSVGPVSLVEVASNSTRIWKLSVERSDYGKRAKRLTSPNNVTKVSPNEWRKCSESVGKSTDGKVVENGTVTIPADGKILTRASKIRGPDGDLTMKSACQKQAGDSVVAQKKLMVEIQ